MKRRLLIVFLCVAMFTLISPLALSGQKGIPHLMRFQGVLGNEKGIPLDGIYTLTFRIYDVETGGAALWEEVHNNVNIADGLVDAELGSITSIELPFDAQYWLGIEIESDGEMAPRFKLTSVPYSIVSEK